MIARASALSRVLQSVRYSFGEWSWQQMPKPWNLPHTRKQKRMLYSKQMRPFKPVGGKCNDTLFMEGLDKEGGVFLYEDFLQSKGTPLSSQYVSMLLYNFSKTNYLNEYTWPRIEPYIRQNRGQYSMRSIFGAMYGCIRYGKSQYLQFFVEQLAGQKVRFTDLEAVEIIEAFNLSRHNYERQFKHEFWDSVFRPYFFKTITPQVRMHNFNKAIRVFDAFRGFDYLHDEQLWNTIIGWLDKRKGWKRVQIIERLYPLTGTFPKAKEVFDKYYVQLSQNKHAQWRYNFEELRLYTSEQMIAKSQENIQMVPSDRTIFRRRHQQKVHDEYHQWLKDGAKQKEAELIKDKAQSLAYAIKDRYDLMKKEKVDFGRLSLEQFQDLFGEYNKDWMYTPPQAQKQQLLDQDGNPIKGDQTDADLMNELHKFDLEKAENLNINKIPFVDQFDLETYQQKRARLLIAKRKKNPKERKPAKKWK